MRNERRWRQRVEVGRGGPGGALIDRHPRPVDAVCPVTDDGSVSQWSGTENGAMSHSGQEQRVGQCLTAVRNRE